MLDLNLRADGSFRLIAGAIEFDPAIEVSKVERTKN
jgi:hypothetical protein